MFLPYHLAIPEALAVQQLDGILNEFDKYGFKADQLVINNVIKEVGSSNFLQSKADQQKEHLEHLYHRFQGIKIVEVPLFPHEIKGIDRLREVERSLFG